LHKKLICNNILYILTLFFFMHSDLQTQCLHFVRFMFGQNEICKCLQAKYCKPLTQKFKKIIAKMKKIINPKMDCVLLQCMLKINGDLHEIFLSWMVKYIQHCNLLKECDANYAISFENLMQALDGVANGLNTVEDGSFYLMYNPSKQKQFGFLVAMFGKIKKQKNENLDLITKMMKVFAALCDKKEGRKYLLQEKVSASHANFGQILALLDAKEEDKEKYDELRVFVDDYFRKLVQQSQDNEEEDEFDKKEMEKRRKIEEIERKEQEKLDKIEKEKEEKEKMEREKKREEERKKKEMERKAMDGDIDAMSSADDSDGDLYESKPAEKEKRVKKKRKNVKKQVERKKFVPQLPPAKFDAVTLRKVFGAALSDKDIAAILALS